MSDFLFSTRPRRPGELRAHLERFLAPVAAAVDERHGDRGSLAVLRGAHDAAPLAEEDGRLSVLVGDPLLRSPLLGAGMVDAGPRREEVHRLARDGEPRAWDEVLEGHFALLAVDLATGAGRLVTDAFSFVPVFHGLDREGGLVVGTHGEAVARACGRARDVDPVSAADLVAHLTCTFPHTLYAGVWQADPATERRFGPDGWEGEGRAYWAPREDPRLFADAGEAAAALRDGFRGALADACLGHPEVGLLMSAGEDSRAVLGAVPAGVRVRAVTYAEWESREVRVARRASARYGAALEVGYRSPRHYLDGFEAVAGMLGSGHLFVDVHGYGLHDRLGLDRLPLVLGGLSSDSLLKAAYARDRKGAPVEAPEVAGVVPELLGEAAERRTAFRDRLARLRPRTADEWDTLWPFSMRKHGGNLDGNRRLFRSVEAFHAMAVLRVAAAAPPEWKRHRRLFLAAMRPFLRPAWDVPHSEYRFPYFGRAGNAALLPLLALTRGTRALFTGEVRARHRPWPRWTRLAAEATQGPDWSPADAVESPIGLILTETRPEPLARAVGGWYSLRRLMLRQLAHVSARAEAA